MRASIKQLSRFQPKVFPKVCPSVVYWCEVWNLPPHFKLSFLRIVRPFWLLKLFGFLIGASERRADWLHWGMWGWQLHLFIMWGTIAHLERQPGLVFSLILAPAQRARINRQDRFICGQDHNSRCARSFPRAQSDWHAGWFVHVILESNYSNVLMSNVTVEQKKKVKE